MALRRSLPTWATLLVGVLLGAVLTSTFTFRLWWCSYDDLLVDRDVLRIVQVNERITAHKRDSSINGGALNEECLCGEELERLKSISSQCGLSKVPVIDGSPRPSSSVIIRPTQASFSPPHPLSPDHHHNDSFTSYLHPPNSSGEASPVQYLGSELSVKRKLVVAVMSSEKHLEESAAVFDTWGMEVDQMFFFVGEGFNASAPGGRGLPIVVLPGVPDYPTNSMHKLFSAVKYLEENYLDTYHWFMFVSVGTYVRANRLTDLLMKLDHSASVYLGRPASGRPEDSDKLGLLPHEFYCLGGPGFVLSNALVRQLGHHLGYCLAAVEAREKEGLTTAVDVEVGRCISRKEQTQCSQSDEVKSYFVENYSKDELRQSVLDSKPFFKDLITYHPVASPREMQHLHYYYRNIEFSESISQAKYIANDAGGLCSAVKSSGAVRFDKHCDLSVCPCEQDATVQARCPNAGVVPTLTSPYTATGRYDLQSWEYFDENTLYNDKLNQPNYWLNMRKDTKHELQVVLSKIMQAVNEGGHRMKFKRVINGWVRHNPFRGSEYIVDAEITDAWRKSYTRRVSLVRPYATNYVTLKDNANTDTAINFVVPISNVDARFREFMEMYEQVCLKPQENTKLILAVYGNEDIAFVNRVLQPYKEMYPSAVFKVREGSGQFSRAKALHLGMTGLADQELAFMCDVDMKISRPFLDRCRKNTISGKRVYFPEFFKLYNLDYVYRSKKRPAKIGVKRQNGHWAHYSYGMLCIYKSDYTTVGGMNTNIVGWGEEDVIFFERVLKKKLEVLRAPDTGLSHRWHEKNCPDSLPSKQHAHCLSSRGENLADRMQLANYIYDMGFQLKERGAGQPAIYNESHHTS